MRYSFWRIVGSVLLLGAAVAVGAALGFWLGAATPGGVLGLIAGLVLVNTRSNAAAAQAHAAARARMRRMESALGEVDRRARAANLIADQLADILHEHTAAAALENAKAQQQVALLRAELAETLAAVATNQTLGGLGVFEDAESLYGPYGESDTTPALAAPQSAITSAITSESRAKRAPAPTGPTLETRAFEQPSASPDAEAPAASDPSPSLPAVIEPLAATPPPAYPPSVIADMAIARRSADGAAAVFFVSERSQAGEAPLERDHRLLRRLPDLIQRIESVSSDAALIAEMSLTALADPALMTVLVDAVEESEPLCRRLRIGVDAEGLLASRAIRAALRPLAPYGDRLALMNAQTCADRLAVVARLPVSHVVAEPIALRRALENGGRREADFIDTMQACGVMFIASAVDTPEAAAAAAALGAFAVHGALPNQQAWADTAA